MHVRVSVWRGVGEAEALFRAAREGVRMTVPCCARVFKRGGVRACSGGRGADDSRSCTSVCVCVCVEGGGGCGTREGNARAEMTGGR